MGWFSSEQDTLKFDVDKIRSMRNKINETVNELTRNKNIVIKDMDDLKKDWVTPTGKKFTKEVDVDWAEQVEKYIRILNAVDHLLSVAERNYLQVESRT